MKLTNLQIEAILDELTYQPNGVHHEFRSETARAGMIRLSLTIFARSSRDWDVELGFIEAWAVESVMEKDERFWLKPLDVSIEFPRPSSETGLIKEAARLVAYLGAHEALEWLFDQRTRKQAWDPHAQGDVEVKL